MLFSKKLIKAIADDKDETTGCELGSVKRSESGGEILVNNFSSVKRTKFNFDKPTYTTIFSKVGEIINELLIYSIVIIQGTLV